VVGFGSAVSESDISSIDKSIKAWDKASTADKNKVASTYPDEAKAIQEMQDISKKAQAIQDMKEPV